MKRPAFQFYPSDWRNDAALKLCSMASRGLWIEMICIMHGADPYGYLCAAGRALDARDLSRLVGETEREVAKWMEELLRNGVCARADDGLLYSRRMVRDEALRTVRAAGGEGGKEFGHLGAEHGKKGGRPRKEEGGKKPPLYPPPSSSSSSSTSEHKDSPVVPEGDSLVQAVLSVYHDTLPKCERIAAITPKRVRRIKTADKLARTLCAQQGWDYAPADFWGAYFDECAADPWMRGDVPNPKNPRWKQNLDVLLAEDRFASVMDRAIASMQQEPAA